MAYIGNNPFVGFAPFTIDTFVGDDVTITFSLSQPRPVNPRSILVVIDGVTQPAVSAYNLDGNLNLEFTEAPPQDSIITVIHMHLGSGGSGGGVADVVNPAEPFDDITFDGTVGPFQLRHGGVAADPYNEYYTLIYVNGIFKRPLIDYTIATGGQITFVGTPPAIGNSFYGLDFGKISITEVVDGSLDGDAFANNVDFGTRDIRIDNPVLGRQLANKQWVESSILSQIPADTTELPEGDNLYYTIPRVRTSLSGAGLITYDSLTGVIGIDLPSYLNLANQRIDTNASPTFIDIVATNNITADHFYGDITGDITGQVSSISNHVTDDLVEGSSPTNVWFTDQRAQDGIESVWVHGNHIGCDVYRNPGTGQYEIRVIIGGGSHSEIITAVTQANPGRLTTITPHGFVDGDEVTITDVIGMTELNGNSYYLDVINSTQVRLFTDPTLTVSLDTTGFTAYISNGFVSGGSTGGTVLTNTDQLPEGLTNKYFTLARFNQRITAINTAVLPDTNNIHDLGNTSFRWNDIWLGGTVILPGGTTLSNNGGYLGYTTGTGNISGKILKTTDLEEISTARFFTEARARSSVSSGTGLSYNSTLGAFANTDLGSSQYIFKSLTVGGNSATAKSNTDSFTFIAGSAISLSLVNGTTPGTSTLTITNTGIRSAAGSGAIGVSNDGNGNITISTTALLSVAGATGISVSAITGGSQIITNTGILDVVAGTGMQVVKAAGAATVSNTGLLYVSSGSGITVTSFASGVQTISNSGVLSVIPDGAPTNRLSSSFNAGTGQVTIDLVTTGVSAGTYNTLTVDVYGRVTVGTNTDYARIVTLTGDVTGSGTSSSGTASFATTLANTAVTAAAYGTTTAKTISFTVDSKGRLTAASEANISITASQVSDFTTSVRGVVSGSSGVSYSSLTGVFSLDNTAVRGLFSGSTGISYNSTTGAISVDSSVVTSADSINKLNDVDTITTAPINNNVLYWNGTNWKPGNQPFPTSAKGSVTGNQILDASSAAHFSATIAGATTFFFTADATSPVNVIMIELTNPGAFSIIWPATVKWPGGSPPTFTVSGVDLLVFISRDGGTIWRGAMIQQDSR